MTVLLVMGVRLCVYMCVLSVKGMTVSVCACDVLVVKVVCVSD